MRLVMIEWEDSHADGSWQDLSGPIADRVAVCRSVGWLMLDGERAKVVAPHLSEEGTEVPFQGNGVMTIPTRAVLRITNLAQHDGSSEGATSSCRAAVSGPSQRASSRR